MNLCQNCGSQVHNAYSIHGTGRFTYIYHQKSTINVGKYTIDGWYGNAYTIMAGQPTPP